MSSQLLDKPVKISLSLLLMFLACSVSPAQFGGKAEPLRIEFKRGTNGTTISGKVRGDEEAEYVLAARKGQRLTIKLTSVPRRSSVFDLKAPDNADLGLEYDANYNYSGVLPVTGDYLLTVARPSGSPGTSRYELTITVGSKEPSGAGDIYGVDFQNFTYRPSCAQEKPVTARTRDGNYTRNNGDDKMLFDVRSVNYGDLTGGGRDEAVILTNCNTGGTGQFSEGFVFTTRQGRPVLLTRIEGGDRAFGGLASAKIEDHVLIVESYAPEEPGMGA